MAGIRDRVWLRPSQLRTVAERRYDDAEFLRKQAKGDNARANAVMYLGGFVIECLLKAKLMEEQPWLQSARDPAKLTKEQKETWELCYRKHDLGAILEHLPQLTSRLAAEDRRAGRSRGFLQILKMLGATWTIQVRYSPHQESMEVASQFMERIKEVKECLK